MAMKREELIRKLRKEGLLDIAQDAELLPSKTRELSAQFIGSSTDADKIRERAIRVAPLDEPVLITGETGTGKELVARIIHGDRDDKGKLVPVNCAAINDNISEAELFGYQKGAFTGANEDRAGLFESAQNGTIFLDEIAEASPRLQSQLLRVLQENRVRRVGHHKEIHVNFRVICATHQDLVALVRSGDFRQDLFWRIYGYNIHIPPLRDRVQDIHELLDALLDPKGYIPQDIRDKLASMPLHGNIRELAAMVRMFHIDGNISQIFNI